MSNETVRLIELINKHKSLNEISRLLKLSNKQIFMRLSMLKNSGYIFDRKYQYNGDIYYNSHNPFINSLDNNLRIEGKSKLDRIRVLLTSDYHLGNIYDDLDSINKMYEYCINHRINIILNCGDFFEGIIHSSRDNKFNDHIKQIKYGLTNYPYDSNILNVVLLGNHDASFWLEKGIDIKKIILERRHDLIPIGYGYGDCYIGNIGFRLEHPIDRSDLKINMPQNSDKQIILRGHSHKFKISSGINTFLKIYVPSLSRVSNGNKNNIIPGMIDMELQIKGNEVNRESIRQFIYLDKKFICISELVYYIPIDFTTSASNGKQLVKNR